MSIPSNENLVDQQFIRVPGPDGQEFGFRYDAQTRTLYSRESEIVYANRHGISHIAEDPIPEATCDSRGLMSSNDKCKLDTLTQTRLGVAGFMGAGFPDDGGWQQGDIVLAAGTEFISIERFGNVIRFTVDSPVPLNCACESCNQIFWVQDETEVSAVRPPVCNGKMPGVNAYGELKLYLLPQSTQVGTNPATALASKGDYPTLIFKRYTSGLTSAEAQFDMVLKRNATNKTTTEVGWSFTPGPLGVAQCVWYLGRDSGSNLIRFDLSPNSEPGLLGAVLYRGHKITKQMGVVTGYASHVVSTNQYLCRYWNVADGSAVGSTFTATNNWQFNNPERPKSGPNPQALVTDGRYGLLPVGTLVDLWEFEVGQVNGVSTYRRYFSRQPQLETRNIWAPLGTIEFGNTLVARDEMDPGTSVDNSDQGVEVDDSRILGDDVWGISGSVAPLIESETILTDGTEEAEIKSPDVAIVDQSIPGLRVVADEDATDYYSTRPVCIWNKIAHRNSLVRLELGKPALDVYPPYDILLHAPIDSAKQVFAEVVEKSTVGNLHMIRIKGVHYHDVPKRGTFRIISGTGYSNYTFTYENKYLYPASGLDSLVLVRGPENNFEYIGAVGDVLELVRDDYTAPCVRLEFNIDNDSGIMSVQFLVGTLDMNARYQSNYAGEGGSGQFDNQVRGLSAGYTVSQIYVQDGPFDGSGDRPTSTPSDFVCYDGGEYAAGQEAWNVLEIMQEEDAVWLWWNGLLVSPSTVLSAQLIAPVDVATPYFPISIPTGQKVGRVGMRLWPGALVRRFEVKAQATRFSEYQYGQILVE